MGRHAIDLVGQKFGLLTVLEKTDKRQNKSVVWKCKCECGVIKNIRSTSLRNDNVTGCGCRFKAIQLLKQKELKMAKPISDLRGKVFGRLTVLEATDQRQGTSVVWKCKCECGGFKNVSGRSLKGKDTTSCGCRFKGVKQVKQVKQDNPSRDGYPKVVWHQNSVQDRSVLPSTGWKAMIEYYCPTS